MRTMIRGLAAGLLAFALLALASGCGTSASPEDFVDNWREPGPKPPYVMHIEANANGVFTVDYARFYPSKGEFRFDDGSLIYSPVTPDMTDVITYDHDDDTITITSGSSGRSYTLIRARP